MTSNNPDEKILNKIKKCLALAASDNPNEAATAMRQASALMERHGITAEAIKMSDIGEAEAPSRTMARNKPAQWEAALASTVGSAFGCKLMIRRMVPKEGGLLRKGTAINDGGYIFVGLKTQAQIAVYTMEVLVRKCKKARSAFIAENLQGLAGVPGGRRTATALGDQFALGWVAQIARVVQEFAHPPEFGCAIDSFIEAATRGSGGQSAVRESATEHQQAARLAAQAGMRAAHGESLHRPVRGADKPLVLAF